MSASMFLATAATPLRPGDGNADVLEKIWIENLRATIQNQIDEENNRALFPNWPVRDR